MEGPMFNRILFVAALALAGCGAAVEDIAPDLDTPSPIGGVTVAPKVCEPLVVVPGEPHVSCRFDSAVHVEQTVHVVFKAEPSTIGASFCNELHECYPIEVSPAVDVTAPSVGARWIAPRHLSLTLNTGDARHWYAVVWTKE